MYAAWINRATQKERSDESPRLLVPQEEALEAFKARSRTPLNQCGVSVAFLSHLHKSLEELKLDGKARSTQYMVARLWSPAGVVHVSPPDPTKHRNSLGVRPMSRSLSIKPAHSGALTSREHAPTSHSGNIGSKEMHTRLWDLVDPYWCGKPSYYVSHAWSGDFLDMLATLVDRLLRQPENKSDVDDDEAEAVDPNTIFVWLDVIALPQQYLGGASSPEGPMFGPPHALISMQEVRDIVGVCERGTVVMLDKDMAILGRAWPLYEVWLAAYYCPQDASTSRVLAAIPKDIPVDALLHLQTSCLYGLDLGRAACTKPEDKQHIMTEVRHAAGQKRVQTLVSETLLRAARGWLRWSGEPSDMGLYAALMMQSKEYSKLQYVLNSVDEIHDDEATLKEIRDLFVLYDEDGTGSLEEDEFAQVLAMAGFGQEESRAIFAQVDTDKGGSVDLEEFEAWWIESQRQHNRSHRPKPELTVHGLVTNLQGLIGMLHKRKNDTAAARISLLVDEIQDAAASSKPPFPDGHLPPSEIFGDWRAVANTLGFKITFNDLRPALRMMHSLLLLNVDSLALDASPASQLPSPNSLGNDMKLQKVVLAWFMALMAELLSRNPSTMREADFFLREAIDISMPEKHETAAHSASSATDAAIQKGRKETVKLNGGSDFQMESIVTNMVRLKHGKDTIVSNKLVAEANISLSAWMAASKEKAHFHPGAPKKGGVGRGSASTTGAASTVPASSIAAFTTSYLSAADAAEAATMANGVSVDGKSTFVANKKAGRKGPYDGMTHAQLARALGLASRAAIKEYNQKKQSRQADSDYDHSDISSASSDAFDSDQDRPRGGRVSPLKMARMQSSIESPTPERSRTSVTGRLLTSQKSKRASLADRSIATPERRRTGLQRQRTLADLGSSYTETRQGAAGSAEPQLHRLHNTTSSNGSGGLNGLVTRAASSLGVPTRPYIAPLRHMPYSGDLMPKTPRDDTSDDESIVLSARQRRGSTGPLLTQIREDGSSNDLTQLPRQPPRSSQAGHHPNLLGEASQPSSSAHFPHTQPQLPTQNPHPNQPHSVQMHPSLSQSHVHPSPPLQPHPPPPRSSESGQHPNPHPQAKPIILQQDAYEGGVKVQILAASSIEKPDEDEETEADAEVRRSLDAQPPPQLSRTIQTPLVGTMRSRLEPGSSLGTHPQAAPQQKAPTNQRRLSSLFSSMPWQRKSVPNQLPQMQQEQDKQEGGGITPMIEKVRGMFNRNSTGLAALQESITATGQHKIQGDPLLAPEMSSLSVPSAASNQPPSVFASQHRGSHHIGAESSIEDLGADFNEARTSPSVAAYMHGGFAQRFATIGAQQRAITPSVQPLVGANDLKALRQRMSTPSVQKRSEAERKHKATNPVASSPAAREASGPKQSTQGPGRESSTKSLQSTISGLGSHEGGGHWGAAPLSPVQRLNTTHLSNIKSQPSHSGRISVELGGVDESGRPGSRLRNATSGYSKMASRNTNAPLTTASSPGTQSKWFSQLSGTRLPSLR